MTRLLPSVFLLAVLLSGALAANFVLLAAGSNGYYNYRHQSDVFHAYHIFVEKGTIPKDNIVLMAYDDIASNPQNPYPGSVINKPYGPEVYEGVNIDYANSSVTTENFLAVLRGDKKAVKGGNGKVIRSGPEDNIFVFYSDHGATGFVCMPSGPDLYADKLLATIKQMKAEHKYNKMVLYIEACESGSMCKDIPADLNVYCTTASTPEESSYAYYWDPERRAYLGDEYSIHWMEDTDVADLYTETFNDQYVAVRDLTTMSHVQQYGDKSIAKQTLNTIFSCDESRVSFSHKINGDPARKVPPPPVPLYKGDLTKVRSEVPSAAPSTYDVVLHTLWQRLRDSYSKGEPLAKQLQLKKMIEQEVHARQKADELFELITMKSVGAAEYASIWNKRSPDFKLTQYDCLRDSMEAIKAKCGRLSDYALKHVHVIASICEYGKKLPISISAKIAEVASYLCSRQSAYRFPAPPPLV